MRIVLIRHGRPDVGRSRWMGRRGFASFIDVYQQAGLDAASEPPPHVVQTAAPARRVFASDLPRSIESARRLLPQAELISDPVFTEAPLASPPLPGVRLKAPAWAVIARVAWHGGYKPGIEGYGSAKQRARAAVDILVAEAQRSGVAVLVAHGYFNAILGRMLRLAGWTRDGTHRAQFWNMVVYDLPSGASGADGAPPPDPARPGRIKRLRERIRRRKAG